MQTMFGIMRTVRPTRTVGSVRKDGPFRLMTKSGFPRLYHVGHVQKHTWGITRRRHFCGIPYRFIPVTQAYVGSVRNPCRNTGGIGIDTYSTTGICISSLRFPSPNFIGRRFPPPALGQSGGEARTARLAPGANPTVPPHRFSKLSDCLGIKLINMVVDSTCRIQRNLILEGAGTHRTTAAFSSKERGNNTQHDNRTNTVSVRWLQAGQVSTHCISLPNTGWRQVEERARA